MITEAATTRQSESDIEISHVVRWSDGEPHNQKLTAEMMGEATTSVSLTAQGKMFVDRYGPNAAWINLSFEQTRELGKWLLSSTRPSVLQRAKDWIASRRRPALVTDEELKAISYNTLGRLFSRTLATTLMTMMSPMLSTSCAKL